PGKANLWDSGRVKSDQSIHIPYAGAALQSNQHVYWTVRVWDRHGAATMWARPAQWTMALLAPADWQAQWLTNDSSSLACSPLAEAHWIWHAADQSAEGPAHAPPGERRFRKS